MTEAPLHVVAVGGLPDEIELPMAQLLIRFSKTGHNVAWIVATDGAVEESGRDSNLGERRPEEAGSGARSKGADHCAWPARRAAWAADGPAIIGAKLERLKPDLIVTQAMKTIMPITARRRGWPRFRGLQISASRYVQAEAIRSIVG